MPSLEVVGGYPEGPGSEETHRRTAIRTWLAAGPHEAAGRVAVPWPRGDMGSLLASRRFRLQAAGLAALTIIVLLIVMLPARKVRIAFDGDVTTVSSHTRSDAAVVKQLGEPAFWVGPGTFADRLSRAYAAITRAALEQALGE